MTAVQTVAFISAAERGMRACQEACRQMRRMVELLNADRAARGAQPLHIEITIPGERP